MPQPLFDAPYIFGIHEPGGEQLMLAARRPGWIAFAEVLGHDPNDWTGVDYTSYSNQGLGILAVLNHGIVPDGTIPHSSQYEAFARRVANFVSISRGCRTWVIGNEMNYAIHRPGVKVDWARHAVKREGPAEDIDPSARSLPVRFNVLPDQSREIRTTRGALISPGEVITPELYARCYRLCRDALHRLPGHEEDLVLVGAVTPWNTQTIYPGNANGDWVQYFQDILTLLGSGGCDGFALHAYTHGADPALIPSPVKLGAPFQTRHLQFRTYTDFLGAVPPGMRDLPAFLTEVGQTGPWLNRNVGWVQAMYADVAAWNRQPGNQQIRAACLYRWPKLDRWYIAGKHGVETDFELALRGDYRWQGLAPPETAGAAPATASAPPPTLPETVSRPLPPAEPPAAIEPPVRPDAMKPARERAAPTSQRVSQRQPRSRAHQTRPQLKPYQVEWIADQFPARLTVGTVLTAPITLRNAGSATWTWGGGNPVRLGYRFYRNRRVLPQPPERELRTDIPEDVLPGQTVVVEARIALPTEPGNYTVELDLVQEGVAWFKDEGSPVLTRWLTVEAPSAASAAAANGTDVQLPVRLFVDISARLPRSAPYARRNLHQIRYIVVNHTGAHPNLALERIARAHIRRGYPGIAYDFVVDPAGQIFKVTDLEEVAQPDQAWSEQGVNVCLSGNFSQQAPPLPQLEAAGRLCAWLAQNVGLTADAIVGLGELIRTDSPGETFYRGPKWKDVLTRQVKLHQAALGAAAGDNERILEFDRLIGELRRQNQVLAGEAAELRRQVDEAGRLRVELEQELVTLRGRVEAQPTTVAGGLQIRALVDKLPRDGQRYVPRTADEVEMIVIHHTGLPPATPIREIAQAHASDWPGILYEFVIDGQGEIFQTQRLDQAPDTPEPYVRRAVGVAFAGDFTERGAPTTEQIAAGGRLLAWLLQRYPQLSWEHVRGLGEVTQSESPGREWNTGRNWKQLLATATRRVGGGAADVGVEDTLRAQLAALEQRLAGAANAQEQLAVEKAALVAETRRLEDELAAKAAAPTRFVVPPPPILVVVDQLPKHPTLRYERRPLNQITHIAVHHTAAPPRIGPARIAELHVAPDPGRGKEAWPGIGYHFFVHEDGAIEQTNQLESASYHVFRHYGYSVGVVFAGSFMNGKIPTTAQLRAGAHLLAWLMQELSIPLARVWGHREFPDNMTVCPGGEWTGGNRWRDLLFERITQIQQGAGLKSLRHYLLFGADAMTGDAYADALAYIARFHPTVGFSVEEARAAEFVTIAGGEAIVGIVGEQVLVQAGCHVERIVGRNPADTAALLADMARAGRRFRTFDAEF